MSIESSTSLNDPSGQLTSAGELLKRSEDYYRVARKQKVTWGLNDPEFKNKVLILHGKIAIEADEDKIIILLDRFKSGFECEKCKGEGIFTQCPNCAGSGANRLGGNCSVCSGVPSAWVNKVCSTCNGNGQRIILMETSKQLPTTGIIVSVGPKCTARKIGQRVLFGTHTGYALPFKGNIILRAMREHEPIASVYMLEDAGDSLADFMQDEMRVDNS